MTDHSTPDCTVTLPPGQIVIPIKGTTHWGPSGEDLGVWGDDLPVRPMLMDADGTIRNLTEAENALFCQTHPEAGE